MAEPLASAQFRMDLNVGGLFPQYRERRSIAGMTVNQSSSGSTMQESGDSESDSILLNAYSLSDDHRPHHYPPMRTLGSLSSSPSSSLRSPSAGDSAAVNESFAAGQQAYHAALSTRNDQTAMVQYGTALENFQSALAMSSPAPAGDGRHSNPQQQHSSHRCSIVMYQALCLKDMGKRLAATNLTAAVASWDQALECLEQVLGECHRYSQRWTTLGTATNTPEPLANLDACMAELLRDKASTLMHLMLESSSDSIAAQQQKDEAMDCIIQALRFLLDVRHFEQTRHIPVPGTPYFVYNCLDISQHSQLLIETLQQMIQEHQQTHQDRLNLETMDSYGGKSSKEEPVWMQRVEQALHILQTRQYELNKPQKMAMAAIHESLSHVYLQIGDLEKGSQAMADACDWLLEEQATPPAQWLDRMELFGNLLEQEAISDGELTEEPHLVDVDAAAALDLAMACYEKALMLRNQCGILLAAQGGPNPVHDLAVANSLSHVARVMQYQGNDEGSMDLFQAAQEIYAWQTDCTVLVRVAADALHHGRWDQAIAVFSQCVELTEAEAEAASTKPMDKTYVYFSLGQAYVGRGDFVSATICLMEANTTGEFRNQRYLLSCNESSFCVEKSTKLSSKAVWMMTVTTSLPTAALWRSKVMETMKEQHSMIASQCLRSSQLSKVESRMVQPETCLRA